MIFSVHLSLAIIDASHSECIGFEICVSCTYLVQWLRLRPSWLLSFCECSGYVCIYVCLTHQSMRSTYFISFLCEIIMTNPIRLLLLLGSLRGHNSLHRIKFILRSTKIIFSIATILNSREIIGLIFTYEYSPFWNCACELTNWRGDFTRNDIM